MTPSALPGLPTVDRFRWLALFTALAAFALIVLGGVARVTGASPAASPLVSALEWSQRGLTVWAGALACMTAAQAWRAYRPRAHFCGAGGRPIRGRIA